MRDFIIDAIFDFPLGKGVIWDALIIISTLAFVVSVFLGL